MHTVRKRGDTARWSDAVGRPALALVRASRGVGARAQGEDVRSQALLAERLALYGTFGDQKGVALARANLGRLEVMRGQLDRAEPLLEASAQIERAWGNPGALGASAHNAALIPLQRGWMRTRPCFSGKAWPFEGGRLPIGHCLLLGRTGLGSWSHPPPPASPAPQQPVAYAQAIFSTSCCKSCLVPRT